MKRMPWIVTSLTVLAFSSCSPQNTLDAMEQSHASTDLEITRQIRQTLLEPNDLSLSAKNVTILANAGDVTLLGIVRSERERHELVEIASVFASDGRVTENLEVWPD